MNTDNDFVYTINKDGSFQSGGYKIENDLIGAFKPIQQFDYDSNELIQTGGNPFATGAFNNIAVPAGLFVLQRISNGTYDSIIDNNNSNHVIETSLYDKLLTLVKPNTDNINNSNKTINKTKKNKAKFNNKTKKTKNN
jgi:hypothetical protein